MPDQINMEDRHVSEELADWQQIHSPFSIIPAQMIDEDGSSSVIKDDFFSEPPVFPPGNHEDLPVSNPECDHQSLQVAEPIDTPAGDGVRRWRRLRLWVLQTGIFRIVGRFRSYADRTVRFWSVAWIAGGVAAALLVSFLRRRNMIWWRRRMRLNSSKESLLTIIKEKDKRISQLLLQIAEMNELLLARRRVTVVRVK